MEKLDKVELVRAKCNVSYEEARKALETCEYDVLDAIILIENTRKPVEPTVPFAKAVESEPAETEDPVTEEIPMEEPEFEAPYESAAAEAAKSKSSKMAEAWNVFCARVKHLLSHGMELTFVAERHGERVMSLPVLVLVIGMLVWGATLWLLVIGLFFGFHYHIEGASAFTVDVNKVMDKAADKAEEIKQSLA